MWEGPLGTPLGLVHWKRASSPVEAGTAKYRHENYEGRVENTMRKIKRRQENKAKLPSYPQDRVQPPGAGI